MRDTQQELKTRHYIENNPVKALLVREPKEWLWSSARFRDENGTCAFDWRRERELSQLAARRKRESVWAFDAGLPSRCAAVWDKPRSVTDIVFRCWLSF